MGKKKTTDDDLTIERDLMFEPTEFDPGAVQTKFTPELKIAFLKLLARMGDIDPTASHIGIHRNTVYAHMKKDPAFADAVHAAQKHLQGNLLRVLERIAMIGNVERHYDKDGNLLRERHVVDRTALMRWLERLERALWSQKVEVSATVEGEVNHKHEHEGTLDIKNLEPGDRNRLRDLLRQMRGETPCQN